MAQNPVDETPYHRLLTDFAVEKGSGGAFIQDLVAIPFEVQSQSYSVPKYEPGHVTLGKTDTKAKGDGSLNVRNSHMPTLVDSRAERRGLKSFIDDDVAAAPNAELFASEQTEIERNVWDLRLEMEGLVKTALDDVQSVSGQNASPSTKWDGVSPTPIDDMQAAARAAELKCGYDLTDPNWKWIVPPLVADVISKYLRDYMKYTDGQFATGTNLPPQLCGITPIIPGGQQNSAAQGQTASVARIWNSDDVYLVYCNPTFASNRRTFTAMAQARWNKVSPSYGTRIWRDPSPDVLRTWVANDIYDNLNVVGQTGIYVLKHVLTTETP